MAPDDERQILRSPASPLEWDVYFDLRWRLLRAPWGQSRGSERDSAEGSAFHLLLLDSAGKAVAGGRLHLTKAKSDIWPSMKISAVVAMVAAFSAHWYPRRGDDRPGKSS